MMGAPSSQTGSLEQGSWIDMTFLLSFLRDSFSDLNTTLVMFWKGNALSLSKNVRNKQSFLKPYQEIKPCAS